MSQLEPGHRELLGALERNDVDYVLIGGVGLQLHGFSQATEDVDVIVERSEENAERISKTLAELGAGQQMPGKFGSTYGTPYGRIDILRDTSGVGPYEAWVEGVEELELEGERIPTGEADALIRSKEASDRAKDHDALPRIRGEMLRAGKISHEQIRGPVATEVERTTEDPRATELLGARPDDRPHAALWDRAQGEIADFRRRWHIGEGEPALGGPGAGDSHQQRDRVNVERKIERTRRTLGRD